MIGGNLANISNTKCGPLTKAEKGLVNKLRQEKKPIIKEAKKRKRSHDPDEEMEKEKDDRNEEKAPREEGDRAGEQSNVKMTRSGKGWHCVLSRPGGHVIEDTLANILKGKRGTLTKKEDELLNSIKIKKEAEAKEAKSAKKRVYMQSYNATATARAQRQNYEVSERGREQREKYRASEQGHARKKESHVRNYNYEKTGGKEPASDIRHFLRDMHLESGFQVSAHSTLLRKFNNRLDDDPPEESDVDEQSLRDAVHEDIRKYCKVTDEDKQRMVEDWERDAGDCVAMEACAACGIRDPAVPVDNKVTLETLPRAHWLRFTQDESHRLDEYPVLTLFDANFSSHPVPLRNIVSYFEDEEHRRYHVHRELLHKESKSENQAPLCRTCWAKHLACSKSSLLQEKTRASAVEAPEEEEIQTSLLQARKYAPPLSIANGVDYGCLSRLGEWLEPPGATECLALAEVRLYSLTAKVHAPGRNAAGLPARDVLRGHFIAFVHDAPTVVREWWDATWARGVLRDLQLVFVGPEGDSTKLEKKALKLPDVQMRPHVLYNHATVRAHLRNASGNCSLSAPAPESLAQIERALAEVGTKLCPGFGNQLSRTPDRGGCRRQVTDERVELFSQASDIAKVRETASSAEHDEEHAEPAKEISGSDPPNADISLVPVAVMCNGAETELAPMFDSLVELFDTPASEEATATEGEQDDDESSAASPTADGTDLEPTAGGEHGEVEEENEKVCRRSVRRENEPVNEFSSNDRLLYGAFWPLIPLAHLHPLKTHGPVSPAQSRHLMTQWHNGFAQNMQFMFLLANQTQRHAAARGVSFRVRTAGAALRDFQTQVQDSKQCIADLQYARENPASPQAVKLLKQMTNILSVAGRRVPWSGDERAGEVAKLFAMFRRFGVPSCFLSLAPDDVHRPKSIRLCYRAGRPEEFPAVDYGLAEHLRAADEAQQKGEDPDTTAPEYLEFCHAVLRSAPDETYEFQLTERFVQMLATKNPVATTLLYEELCESVFTLLLGMPPSFRRRKTIGDDDAEKTQRRGVLGRVFGWAAVTESSGRQALHFHAAIHGGATPTLLGDVALLGVGYEKLQELVFEAIDSMYVAHAPIDEHAADVARKTLRLKTQKHAYFHIPWKGVKQFERNSRFIAMDVGIHNHCETCRKTKAGKSGCRMARPAGHPVENTRVLALEAAETVNDSGEETWRCEECGWTLHVQPKDRWSQHNPEVTEESAADREVQRKLADGTRGLRLRVREPDPSDSQAVGVTLSFELKRPHLNSQDCISVALRDYLQHCSPASLSDAECVEIVESFAKQFHDAAEEASDDIWMRRSQQLLDKVSALPPPAARAVLKAWDRLRCRNAIFVEFSPVLTGLTKSNTAPIMLGGGNAAKGAGLYMVKYMIKEAYQVSQALSVLCDARKHVAAYPSIAEDSGAPDRTTKHFLQRVLNKSLAELSATQAAAIVLGVPSALYSHGFVFSYVWDAVRLTSVMRRGKQHLREAQESEDAVTEEHEKSESDEDSDQDSDREKEEDAAETHDGSFDATGPSKEHLGIPVAYCWRIHCLCIRSGLK